jgi:hypothetical protein
MIRAVFNVDPWKLEEEEFADLGNEADWWVRNCLHPQSEQTSNQGVRNGKENMTVKRTE